MKRPAKTSYECPLCADERPTMNGIYWHLKFEHDQDSETAYDLAGTAERILEYADGSLLKLP